MYVYEGCCRNVNSHANVFLSILAAVSEKEVFVSSHVLIMP